LYVGNDKEVQSFFAEKPMGREKGKTEDVRRETIEGVIEQPDEPDIGHRVLWNYFIESFAH
jgi:hypothetical protein